MTRRNPAPAPRFWGAGWRDRLCRPAGLLACLLLPILTVVAAPGVARAGFVSGAELLELCEDAGGGGFAEMHCLGYVTAVADVLEGNGVNGLRACIPEEGADVGQLAEVVEGYLRRHPERGAYAAAGLVADALGEAFPCR